MDARAVPPYKVIGTGSSTIDFYCVTVRWGIAGDFKPWGLAGCYSVGG